MRTISRAKQQTHSLLSLNHLQLYNLQPASKSFNSRDQLLFQLSFVRYQLTILRLISKMFLSTAVLTVLATRALTAPFFPSDANSPYGKYFHHVHLSSPIYQ